MPMPDAPVLLKSLRSHFLGGREVAAGGLPVLRKQVAVSYTHLDVYKRQG